MTYQPMANDRRDFDPMGQEWGYVPDEHPGQEWRGMVACGLRPSTWPYKLYTDRHGKDPYGAVRLAPDWCLYAWGNEYVSASWVPESPHAVTCRTVIERRYAPPGQVSDWPRNPFAGEGNDHWQFYQWSACIVVNLLTGEHATVVSPAGRPGTRPPVTPDDVRAEAEHKAAKLLAFFRAECERWRAGEPARPLQAHALHKALDSSQASA